MGVIYGNNGIPNYDSNVLYEKEEGKKLTNEEIGVFWLTNIRNSRDYYQDYRRDAYAAWSYYKGNTLIDVERRNFVYNDITNEISTRMNIFHTNVDILSSMILQKMPAMIVRKRFSKNTATDLNKRKFYNVVCEIIEKTLDYFVSKIPPNKFKFFKYDYFITGMGNMWVSYEEKDTRKGEPGQVITFDRVSWANGAMDVKADWDDVKWMARRSFLTKREFKKAFPDIELSKMRFTNYNSLITQREDYTDIKIFTTGDSFMELWEIRDKDSGKQYFVSEQYKDKLILDIELEQDDFFFPTTSPLLSVIDGNSMKPKSEFFIYAAEAFDLAEASLRISQLIKSIQVKSFTFNEYAEIANALNSVTDNFIVTTRASKPMPNEQVIYPVDNKPAMEVVQLLQQYIDYNLDKISYMTGISDAMRNMSTEENATSARLKAKQGSSRLQDRQREVNNYIRQLYVIAANYICDNFKIGTFKAITGISLRHKKDVEQDMQWFIQTQENLHLQLLKTKNEIDIINMQIKSNQDMQELGPQQGIGEQMLSNQPKAPQGQMQTQAQVAPVPPSQNQQQQVAGQPNQQQPEQPQQGQDVQQILTQMQQQLQQLQQQELRIHLRLEKLRNEVTWEKVIDYIRNNRLRDFLVDVDTDFEGLEDDPLVIQERVQFLQLFMNTFVNIKPLMEQDPSICDYLSGLLATTFDCFRVNRQQRGMMEDYLYNMVEEIKIKSQNAGPPQPNPDILKGQAAIMEAQARMMEVQIKSQQLQAEMAARKEELYLRAQNETNIQREKIIADNLRTQGKIQSDSNKANVNAEVKRAIEDKKVEGKIIETMIKERMKAQLLDKKSHSELLSDISKTQADLAKTQFQNKSNERMAQIKAVTEGIKTDKDNENKLKIEAIKGKQKALEIERDLITEETKDKDDDDE
jgi:hypothetical protein